jgi:hypothetical protein
VDAPEGWREFVVAAKEPESDMITSFMQTPANGPPGWSISSRELRYALALGEPGLSEARQQLDAQLVHFDVAMLRGASRWHG